MEMITSWNLPRVLLDLIPEIAPALARLAVNAFDIDPDALGLPDDEAPRLKPGYRADPHKPMSLIELTEAYEPSAHDESLKAALGSRVLVEFGPYRVLSQFKHAILVPALRDPGSQDLVDRAGRFLEARPRGRQVRQRRGSPTGVRRRRDRRHHGGPPGGRWRAVGDGCATPARLSGPLRALPGFTD